MKDIIERIMWTILAIACGMGVAVLGFVIVLGILTIIQALIG